MKQVRKFVSVLWLFFVSILMQVIFLLVFYRKVIRPLPLEINRYILGRHLEGNFMDASLQRAETVKNKLIQLEKERCEAIVECRALKHKQLSTTATNHRKALRRTIKQLGDQIDELELEYSKLYAEDRSALRCIRKFEEIKVISMINSWIDKCGDKG